MTFRGGKAELLRSLRLIPHILAGRYPDKLGLHPLFWGILGNAVLKLLQDGFEVKLKGGRALDGVRWAKLAVATLARRRRAGRDDDDILLETGSLLNSLAPGPDEHPNPVAPDQIFRLHRDGVEVGTADDKADRHQSGTEYMPARPVVPAGRLTRAWEDEVEHACRQAVVKVIEKVVAAGGVG